MILPRADWCAWFAGFVDAEGSFNIYRGTAALTIKLRDDDEAVLRHIASMTGLGRFCYTDGSDNQQRAIIWTVSHRDEVRHIIKVLERADAGAWECWFAGFVDGEGSFKVGPKSGTALTLHLRDDDKPLLLDIQRRLGGHVRDEPASENTKKLWPGAKDGVRWSSRVHERHAVLEALEGNMRSKKRRDFEVWAKAIRRTEAETAPRSPERRAMLDQFKTELQAVRAYK